MQKYVFAVTFYCLIHLNCIATINLQAAPMALGVVCLLVYYKQCYIYDVLGSIMFELLFIVVSVVLFITIKSFIVSLKHWLVLAPLGATCL